MCLPFHRWDLLLFELLVSICCLKLCPESVMASNPIVNLFYTIKSSVHTLRNFRILTQFSWRFWSLLTCLQPTPSPFFSSIHALVFLVRILVIGCPLYLGVLGLYSSRWFGFSPSFLKKQNLHSPPFFLQVSSQP